MGSQCGDGALEKPVLKSGKQQEESVGRNAPVVKGCMCFAWRVLKGIGQKCSGNGRDQRRIGVWRLLN